MADVPALAGPAAPVTMLKDADSLNIGPLVKREEFEEWIYETYAAILAAGAKPRLTKEFIRELKMVETVAPLAVCEEEMERIDARLFNGVLKAIKKHPDHEELHRRIRNEAEFGCGRQALKIVTLAHIGRKEEVGSKAARRANTESISKMSEVGPYLVNFVEACDRVAESGEKMPEVYKRDLLSLQLEKVPELAAEMAQWEASDGSSEDLIARVRKKWDKWKDKGQGGKKEGAGEGKGRTERRTEARVAKQKATAAAAATMM